MVFEYQLPKLPYELDALEPVISKEIMNLHYNKHHAGYVVNLNNALKQHAEAEEKNDLKALIGLQQAIKFNGGGHLNHSIFWTNLAPIGNGGGVLPENDFSHALKQLFGSQQNFIDQISAQTNAIQGSGWGWLGYCTKHKRLVIRTQANQDPLTDIIPLLGIDVWEHAYYLQYKNVRADYTKAIWQIINWENVSERYAAAIGLKAAHV